MNTLPSIVPYDEHKVSKSSFQVMESGVKPFNPSSISLNFYIKVYNSGIKTLMVEGRMVTCCLFITTEDTDCDSMKLLTSERIMVSPNKTATLVMVYVNNYIIDRKGKCTVEIVHSMTVTSKHTIHFDTYWNHQRRGMKDQNMESVEDPEKLELSGMDGGDSSIRSPSLSIWNDFWTFFKGNTPPTDRQCSTVDSDRVRNCIPVDCTAKYCGYRNHFNTLSQMCEKVPICSDKQANKQHTYYDAQCNCCKKLSQSLDEMEMIALVNVIQRNAHQIHQQSDWSKNYPKVKQVKCIHGVEVLGGLSCDCDDKWTTYSFESKFIVPGRDVVEMCNIPVDKFTTTMAPPLLWPQATGSSVTRTGSKFAGILERIKSALFGVRGSSDTQGLLKTLTSTTQPLATSPLQPSTPPRSTCPCGPGSKIPKEICSCPAGFAPMIPQQLIPQIIRMYQNDSQTTKPGGGLGAFVQNLMGAKSKKGPTTAKADTKVVANNTPGNAGGPSFLVTRPVWRNTIVPFNTRVITLPTEGGKGKKPNTLTPSKNASFAVLAFKESKETGGSNIHLILGIIFIALVIVTIILIYINWELVKKLRNRPEVAKYFGTINEKEALISKGKEAKDTKAQQPRKYGIAKQDAQTARDGGLELKAGDLIVEMGTVEIEGYMTGISLRLNKRGIFRAKNVDIKTDSNPAIEAYYKNPPPPPPQPMTNVIPNPLITVEVPPIVVIQPPPLAKPDPTTTSYPITQSTNPLNGPPVTEPTKPEVYAGDAKKKSYNIPTTGTTPAALGTDKEPQAAHGTKSTDGPVPPPIDLGPSKK